MKTVTTIVRFIAATAGQREYSSNLKWKTFQKVAYSQIFFHIALNLLHKGAKSISLLSAFPLVQTTQESGLAPSFGDLSRSEKIFCN